MAGNKDLYAVLGVAPTASQDEICAAMQRLTLAHGPESSNGDAKLFEEVEKAFAVLSDAQQRAEYDETLRAIASTDGTHDTADASVLEDLDAVEDHSRYAELAAAVAELGAACERIAPFIEHQPGLISRVDFERDIIGADTPAHSSCRCALQ